MYTNKLISTPLSDAIKHILETTKSDPYRDMLSGAKKPEIADTIQPVVSETNDE